MITARDVDTIYEVPLVLQDEGLDRVVLQAPRAAADRSAHAAAGKSWSSASSSRTTSSRFTSSASTPATRTPTSASTRRCTTAGSPTACASTSSGSRPKRSSRKAARACSKARTASWCRAASASRGTRGMMKAAEYARQHNIPYFGICYGFQWATVEFARNVCGLEGADSTEFDEAAPHKVIYKLRDLLGVDDLGGTMRLGRYACELAPGSLARRDLRHRRRSTERHRHRFEFNCLYEPALREHGMRISGRSPDGKFVEIAELPEPSVVHRACSSTPSSSRGRCGRIRCLPASSAPRYRQKAGARRARRSTPTSLAVMDRSRSRSPAGLRDVRHRAPAGVHPRPVRHRERGARPRHGRRACRRSPRRARRAARLQGVVRQGQPHVAERRSAAPASTTA